MLDATRISDGAQLMLKRVNPALQPNEVTIGRFFSTEPHSTHKNNHCIPIYDVLDVPDDDTYVIIVMPFLSSWDTPAFDTVGETVEFFRQIFKVSGGAVSGVLACFIDYLFSAFQGLQFMHSLNVAHK